MHNNRKKNLEFKIVFTETNIRHLLGETPIDRELIARHKRSIREARKELEQIKANRDEAYTEND
jgi:hypothetical protein